MFGFGKKKAPKPIAATGPDVGLEMWRDLLYADGPLEAGIGKGVGTAWAELATAAEAIRRSDPEAAVPSIQKVLDTPDLESRTYLIAWNAWRGLGQPVPTEQAQRVLGTVVEVAFEEGVDLLAAWSDGRAR